MDETSMRRVSRGMLGNQHKLEIVAAIADVLAEGAQDFYARQISKAVPSAADNQVSDVFKQLHEAGLLIPVEEKGDRLRKLYRARESEYWTMCRALRHDLLAAAWEPGEDF